MAKQTPEGKVKAKVQHELLKLEALYYMPVNMTYAAAAVDFLVCYRGHFLAIETKVKPRKATARQLNFMAKVIEAGGSAVVVYEIEDLMKALAAIDAGHSYCSEDVAGVLKYEQA
jgi:hypothetical protein